MRFDPESVDPDDAGAALLVGFPDRLAARRRPGQFQLRNGTGAWVADDDPLATAPFVVAADLDGKRSGARIRLGAAVDEPTIAALLEGVVEDRRLEWDADVDDLVERVERRLDALRLGVERRRPSPGDETTAALVARVRATKLAVLPWAPGDRAAPGAGGLPARDARRPVAGRLRPRAAGHARRVVDAVPHRRHRSGRPRPARPRRAPARPAAVAARRRARRAGAAGVAAADGPRGDDRLRGRAPDGVGPRAGRLRRDRAPDRRRRTRAADAGPAVAGRPADPGHGRPPGVLDRVVGRRAQGPRRPLPEAPLAGGPRRRPTPAASRTADAPAPECWRPPECPRPIPHPALG